MDLSNLTTLLSSITNTLLPILAIIIGASVQYYVSKAIQKRKRGENLRTRAYADFLRGSAGLAIAQGQGDKAHEVESAILLTDARARITIYGNKEVVHAVAEFFRAGGRLDTKEQMQLYLVICEEMRRQGMPKDSAATRDIAQLLFGSDLEAHADNASSLNPST